MTHGRWVIFVGLVLAIAALLLAAHQALATYAAEPWAPGASVGLSEVRGGELLCRRGERFVPLPRGETDIELLVTGVMAHATLAQSFHNPSSEVIEVVYVFPLPDRAAVNHMEMRIGERRIVSVVKERRAAKRTYRKAKREGRKAALLDQERPNLFTMQAANIGPGETVLIRLEYHEELAYRDGEFEIVFPLTFTPRFVPPGAPRIPAPFVQPSSEHAMQAALRATLQIGIPLESIDSPSHAVSVREHDGIWQVRPVAGSVRADRDFILRWRVAPGQEPVAALFTEERDDGHYGLLFLMPPPADACSGHGLPTETLFVIDVSGSMAGPSIRQAREALLSALDRLRPDDTFNILKFNNTSAVFRRNYQTAGDSGTLRAARRWVRALRAEGGTMILPALQRAVAMTARGESGHVRRILFLTDGAAGNEAEVFSEIARGLDGVRLHTIGIGRAPNRYLMHKMADFGRGLCDFVADVEGAENRIDSFFARIDRPVLTDLRLRWRGFDETERYPERLPDLHAGMPLLVSFRLDGAPREAAVDLRGRLARSAFRTTLPVCNNAQAGSGVAARWARAKTRSLMDSLNEGAVPEEVRAAVVDVGLRFNLVTKYTSLVAVEKHASVADAARRVQMPGTLPAGSRLMGLPRGGTAGPLRTCLGVLCALVGIGLLRLSKAGAPGDSSCRS